MQQTLLAFLAMMMLTWLMYGQTRSTIGAQQNVVNAQFELMATAVATERMDYIASHPFDAKTADGTVGRSNQSLSALTPTVSFGTSASGCIVASTCKDLDDFHQHADTVTFEDGTEVQFAVTSTVAYVTSSGTTSSNPTWTKEVVVKVQALPLYSEQPFLYMPVEMSRRFSPSWSHTAAP